MRILVGVIGVVLEDLVLVLSVSLLFLYTFKGPFNTNLIYFTFIKSVAINKDWHFLFDLVFSKEFKCDQPDQFLQVSACLHTSKNKITQIQTGNRFSACFLACYGIT